MVLAVAVVMAMGSEPGHLHTTSLAGVAIALLSNLCYAFRNIGMKQICKNKLTLQDFSHLSNGEVCLIILYADYFKIALEPCSSISCF